MMIIVEVIVIITIIVAIIIISTITTLVQIYVKSKNKYRTIYNEVYL